MEQGNTLLSAAVTLGDIIDPDSLQRVCMSFARLHQTGITVLDDRGEVLVDIPAEHLLCRRLGARLAAYELNCSFDHLIQATSERVSGDGPVARMCVCGLRCDILAIRHQGQQLGCLIFGPYRPEGLEQLTGETVEAVEQEEPDREKSSRCLDLARADLARLPVLSAQRASLSLGALSEVLTVIVQAGYARHLTSQIHIAAIQDAYNELTEKNRRLADSVEKLKELDKLKSSFLATVSHELRTPLTSVIGYSEMLLEGLAGTLNAEQRDYVQTIMEKGDNLLHIINEILDISKIESGSVQLSCEQFDISGLLRQVSDALMPQARRKGVTLQYEVHSELPQMRADRAKTRQVLLNLVSNAIKFTPKGGYVVARACESEIDAGAVETLRAIEITVKDTGIGVPREARDRIFEAFYQIDGSSTREYGGTGLGLSIVKHFVEAHGGRVWVESPDEEHGSVFVVRMPVHPPAGTPAAEALRPIQALP